MRAFLDMIFLKMLGFDASFCGITADGGSTTGSTACSGPNSGSLEALAPLAPVPVLLFNEKTLMNVFFMREASPEPGADPGDDDDDDDDDDEEQEPTFCSCCWFRPGTRPCCRPPISLSSRGAALEIMLKDDAECDFSKDSP